MIFTPQGIPYYTSGIYEIKQVDHQISAGTYTCELTLWKNAFTMGDLRVKAPIANVAQRTRGSMSGSATVEKKV